MKHHILCLLVFMTTLNGSTASAGNASQNKLPLHGWKLLAPLPDPVGYGGLFAGVLNGRLVAGGGSQFRDKPFWLKGEKVFSDRIFTLASLQDRWVEHPTKLPLKVGNFATAATADAIYLAGGIDATGCLRQVLKIQAQGDGFKFTCLSELPQPVGYGAAAVVDDRLYLLGGVENPASKTPSAETWSLDLKASADRATWRREADFPGGGVFVATLGVYEKTLYVFSGIGFDSVGMATPGQECLSPEHGGREMGTPGRSARGARGCGDALSGDSRPQVLSRRRLCGDFPRRAARASGIQCADLVL